MNTRCLIVPWVRLQQQLQKITQKAARGMMVYTEFVPAGALGIHNSADSTGSMKGSSLLMILSKYVSEKTPIVPVKVLEGL